MNNQQKLEAVTEAKENRKCEKSRIMLLKLEALTQDMLRLTELALLEKNMRSRDIFIEKIIKRNEQIEHLYSNNWH